MLARLTHVRQMKKQSFSASTIPGPLLACCCFVVARIKQTSLPEAARLALRLEQRQDVALADGALDVAHDEAVLVVQELDADLGDLLCCGFDGRGVRGGPRDRCNFNFWRVPAMSAILALSTSNTRPRGLASPRRTMEGSERGSWRSRRAHAAAPGKRAETQKNNNSITNLATGAGPADDLHDDRKLDGRVLERWRIFVVGRA